MGKFRALSDMYDAAGAAGIAAAEEHVDGYRDVYVGDVSYSIVFYPEPIGGRDVIFSARQISTSFIIQRWADSNNLTKCEEAARSVIRAAEGAFKP